MKQKIKLLAILAMFSLASTINAQEPIQSACDDDYGAGYGLCNAYCEAMDCDGSEGDPQASDIACNRVAEKYTRVTGFLIPCTSCGGGAVGTTDQSCTGQTN